MLPWRSIQSFVNKPASAIPSLPHQSECFLYFRRRYASKSYNECIRILNLKPGASKQEIRQAYISLSKEYHPDINKDNSQAQKKFVQINEAYSLLSKGTVTETMTGGSVRYKFTFEEQEYQTGAHGQRIQYDEARKRVFRRQAYTPHQHSGTSFTEIIDDFFTVKRIVALLAIIILYKVLAKSSGKGIGNRQMEAGNLVKVQKTNQIFQEREMVNQRAQQEIYRAWGFRK